MDSTPEARTAHAVCIPYPAQGHINPMLKLAKILHHKGFHITFINTEYNHRRLLRSRGHDSLNGIPNFEFKTIPDGLPPCDANTTQNVRALNASTRINCLTPFRHLINQLNYTSNIPPVSCIVSDGIMSFTLTVAEELGIPEVLLWTSSVSSFTAYLHYYLLIQRGLIPLKDESYLTNGYLETPIDCIPGMSDIRFRDLPRSARTTDPKDNTVDFVLSEMERVYTAKAIIFNTFFVFDQEVLKAIESGLPRPLPPIYTLGPLHLLHRQVISTNNTLESIGSNLWKEEPACLEWLDSKDPNSVVYVNFGSVTVMTTDQLIEFAWGLSNSKHPFLWIIRPDLVAGDSAILPQKILNETRERGILASWCSQEQVLSHPSVGGFLTHCGWNSILESVGCGVPMICWPFFSDQTTNCRYCCSHWGIGMEIENNVKRGEVKRLVKELMEGEKSKDMKVKVMEWKRRSEEAVAPGGSSYMSIENMINQVLPC